MYFKKTFKKFFAKDLSHDLYWLLLGLIFLFSFAFIYMQEASWIYVLGVSILGSSTFRYITTDENLFAEEINELKSLSDIFDFILSKNLFAIFFISVIIIVVFLITAIIQRMEFINNIAFDLNVLILQLILVLGTENIILMFNDKPVQSYDSGYKRNISNDISAGIKNYKSMIPTIMSNLFFIVMLFYFKLNISIFHAMIYYIVCILIFIYYKKVLYPKIY